MKKDLTQKIFMYVLGAIIVIGFFLVIGLLIGGEISPTIENVLYMMLGALTAQFGNVVQFFYGSSAGSKDKTDMLLEQNKNQNGDNN